MGKRISLLKSDAFSLLSGNSNFGKQRINSDVSSQTVLMDDYNINNGLKLRNISLEMARERAIQFLKMFLPKNDSLDIESFDNDILFKNLRKCIARLEKKIQNSIDDESSNVSGIRRT